MANGHPSENFPPLAQTSGYATGCGGRHFSTRPWAALPHVGSLCVAGGVLIANGFKMCLKYSLHPQGISF